MADDLERLNLAERLLLIFDLSPDFREMMEFAFDGMPVEQWDHEYAVKTLHLAFGAGIVAGQNPEVLESLRKIGFMPRLRKGD